MMRRFVPLALLLFPLAACDRQPAPEPAPRNALTAATPSPVATHAPADLERYVGSYPTDAVKGASFLTDPAVKAAVGAAVPDAAVRDRVLDTDVTATPVVLEEGRVLSYGCEPHNCGPHNWSIVVTRDGTTAGVCYYDEDTKAARWYPQGFAPPPTGGCPSGSDD